MVTSFLGEIATGLGVMIPAFFGAILDGFTELFIVTVEGAGGVSTISLTPVGGLAICFIVIGIAYKIAPTVLGFLKLAFKKKSSKGVSKARKVA